MSVLTIKLQPKQDDCVTLLSNVSGPQYIFYGGAKFGGKSHLIQEWMHMRRMQFPGTNGVIIRATYEEVFKNHVLPMIERHPELNDYYNKSDKVFNYPNGSKLFFQYCTSEADARSSFWGIQYPDMALDEGTDHEEGEFKILKLSNRVDPAIMGRYPNFRPRFLIGGNPGGIGHVWCQRLFIDRQFTENEKPGQYGFVQAFLDDNPLGTAANPEYEGNLMDLPEDLRQAYRYGRWDVFAGQYFKGYKIIPTRPMSEYRACNLFAGLDWGRRDAASSHIIAVGHDGKHTVCRETYATGTVPDDFGRAVRSAHYGLKIQQIFADPSIWAKDQYGREIQAQGQLMGWQPSTPYSIANQIESAGLVLTRSVNDRLARWMRMNTLMNDGKFEVMECCVYLINELKYAVYNTKGTTDRRRKEDIDEKCKDHGLDDVGYCCLHTSKPGWSQKPRKTEIQIELDRLMGIEEGGELAAMGIGEVHGGV